MPETTKTHAEPVDLRKATRHVMVDFNQMRTFTANPLIMVDGDGIRLTDHEGQSYIDALSGVFAVSLGHGNAEIIDAIVAQHRRLSFSSPIMTTTDPPSSSPASCSASRAVGTRSSSSSRADPRRRRR